MAGASVVERECPLYAEVTITFRSTTVRPFRLVDQSGRPLWLFEIRRLLGMPRLSPEDVTRVLAVGRRIGVIGSLVDVRHEVDVPSSPRRKCLAEDGRLVVIEEGIPHTR